MIRVIQIKCRNVTTFLVSGTKNIAEKLFSEAITWPREKSSADNYKFVYKKII
jgi:hypothetical protein